MLTGGALDSLEDPMTGTRDLVRAQETAIAEHLGVDESDVSIAADKD